MNSEEALNNLINIKTKLHKDRYIMDEAIE